MKLLLIEDYKPLLESLKQGFLSRGIALDLASDGEEGLWYALENVYDVIVLDLMLPKMNGLQILKTLRQQHNRTPVLILTAKGEVSDRVTGLNLGADDYLTKPFSFKELLARVRVLVRRSHQQVTNTIQVEDLVIDMQKHIVKRGMRTIELTQKEYSVLECLALRNGSVVSKQMILENLYEFDHEVSSNVVDVHIKNLRKKIDHDCEAKLIHTKRGHGYFIGRVSE